MKIKIRFSPSLDKNINPRKLPHLTCGDTNFIMLTPSNANGVVSNVLETNFTIDPGNYKTVAIFDTNDINSVIKALKTDYPLYSFFPEIVCHPD